MTNQELVEKLEAESKLQNLGYIKTSCKACNGLGFWGIFFQKCSVCEGKGYSWLAPITK